MIQESQKKKRSYSRYDLIPDRLRSGIENLQLLIPTNFMRPNITTVYPLRLLRHPNFKLSFCTFDSIKCRSIALFSTLG